MNIWVPLVAAVGSIAQMEAAPEPLTLEEAVAIGVSRAFAIQLAASESLAAEAAFEEARNGLGPSLNVTGTYSRFDDNTVGGQLAGVNFGGEGEGDGSQEPIDFPNDSASVALTLSQVIDVSGAIRSATRAAEFSARAADASIDVQMNAVKSEVRTAFLTALQADALVQVREEQVGAAEDRLENAQIRFEAQEIPAFDVLRLETDLSSAEQQLLVAEGNARLALQALNNTMGLPIGTEYRPVEPGTIPDMPGERQALVALALENRPELRATRLGGLAAEQFRRAAEGADDPTMVLQASHTRTLDPGFGAPQFNTQAAVVVSWNVFDNGITRARVRGARQQERQSEIRLEQLTLGIALQVEQARTNVETAAAALGVAEKAEELARESLRLAQLRFDADEGILLEVTTAQAELTAAQTNVVNARFAYRIAYADLQAAVGRDDLSVETTAQDNAQETEEGESER